MNTRTSRRRLNEAGWFICRLCREAVSKDDKDMKSLLLDSPWEYNQTLCSYSDESFCGNIDYFQQLFRRRYFCFTTRGLIVREVDKLFQV